MSKESHPISKRGCADDPQRCEVIAGDDLGLSADAGCTGRLVLRRLTEADASSFLAYRNDPEVARYQSWDGCTPAEAGRFIRRQQVQVPGVPGEWLQIAIALKATNQLIGDCALRVHATDTRQATIGITLARPHQGQGIATEALSSLLDHAFGRMSLHRVVADTDPRNTRSWGLLERLGMRREGHFRQSLWFKGRWADEFLYAILRKEWLAKRKTGGLPRVSRAGRRDQPVSR